MQLNLDAAIKARNEGMDIVEQSAGEQWQELASNALKRLCQLHDYVTSDEARVELEMTVGPIIAKPHDSRAWGPVFKRAQREGLITPTGSFRTSRLVSRHGGPIRVWRVLHHD